jgi:hypothetical protein
VFFICRQGRRHSPRVGRVERPPTKIAEHLFYRTGDARPPPIVVSPLVAENHVGWVQTIEGCTPAKAAREGLANQALGADRFRGF